MSAQHDFRPAVESLVAIHSGQPGRPTPPRTLPPRPLPAHLRTASPPPVTQWRRARHDAANVGRLARARRALARITRRPA